MIYNFSDVEFHIKEFLNVYIFGDYSLALYKPYHLETRDKEGGKEFKYKDNNEDKIHTEQEIVKINSVEERERLKEQKCHIEQSKREKEIEKLKLNANNINDEFEKLNDDSYMPPEVKTQSNEDRREVFKDYDIFYDIYTDREREIKNEYVGIFKVEDGIAKIPSFFFAHCFSQGIYSIIPRLISNAKDENLHFDPVPLEDKGFVITEFCKCDKDKIKKNLTFQRRIAEVENEDFRLQPPSVFKKALEGGRDITEDDRLSQAEAIQNGSKLRAQVAREERDKLGKIDDEMIEALKQRRERKQPLSEEEVSILGYTDFIKRMEAKAEEYDKIVNGEKSTKEIKSKDIGDSTEYNLATRLFKNRSTRAIVNRRKMDANFNFNGMNYTIPDFLVKINEYPSIVEVKNVQTQSLTEQISFELKLAREYDLDYVFVCNNYTKLTESIAGKYTKSSTEIEKIKKEEINEREQKKQNGKKHTTPTSKLTPFDSRYDSGSRSGFIAHIHSHRSIRTAFKEIYLHHTKGAAPNKIVIKRYNLNDPKIIEKEMKVTNK